MNGHGRLPIKVVPPMDEDFYRPEAGGGDPKVFAEPSREFRQRLAAEVIGIRDHFNEAFELYPQVPAVARATIRHDAVAKSHRPTKILSDQTCPIIGSEGLGELLLSVSRSGLEQLARSIESDQTKYGIANLSTIEAIKPYVPLVNVSEETSDRAKVKLFRHRRSMLDEALDTAFHDVIRRLNLHDPVEINYGRGLKVFRVSLGAIEAIGELSRFVGIESVGTFPIYQPVRTAATPVRGAVSDDFPQPMPGETYPIVGMVDSGTTVGDPLLGPWIHAREEYVPQVFQDNTHGNFVGGLIVHGRRLNHDDPRFPSCSARIVDIVALGKSGTSEDELITILEESLTKYPDVKVWNLSLGTPHTIDKYRFSDFAVALDRIQDDYGVTFILAAGNYRQPPFRGWPPDPALGEADRICAPADSVRALVVGSAAHRDHSTSRVMEGAPSPFSRRGPGPLYLPKPDLSHIGGNCKFDGSCSQIGVLSLDGAGNVAEDIGTSFATPLITSLHANVAQRIVGGVSREMTKALLIHSAALKTGSVDSTELQYRGFGIPSDVDDMLGCEPWQCTLMFELSIAPQVAFEKALFPMPASLYVNPGTLRANILMTLVYEPALDASFGSEYCRTNVEVSLGTYDLGKDGKRHQKKQVPADPQLKGSGYEADLVEHGFKWSPVKVYRREMVRGVQGQVWRLDLSVHHRSGHGPQDPLRAALVITVADPNRNADVYNEMVVQMNNLGWAPVDLQIQPRIRV